MRPNPSRKIIFENNGSQSSRLFHARRNTSRVGPCLSQDSRCFAQTKRSVPIFRVVSRTSDSTVTGLCFLASREVHNILLPPYRPRTFSIALIIIFFASWPERFATVKCAMDSRRRIFVLVSIEISLICIATRGALRLIIVIAVSLFLAKISPRKLFSS